MSYIYLQEQGEASSADCFSDISQFVQSKLNLTAEKSSYSGNETESCRGSLSGMMSAPLTASHGEGLQKSCAVASPAKIFHAPEKVQGLTVNGLDCGQRWPGSFLRYDRSTSLWKTHQCSLLGDSDGFSETWPRWGLMQDGECWELTTLAPSISGNEYGFLPTPIKSDGDGGGICRSKNGKEYNLRDWWANLGLGKKRQNRRPEFWEWVMGWPENWSDLQPLETVKFRWWLQQHGRF